MSVDVEGDGGAALAVRPAAPGMARIHDAAEGIEAARHPAPAAAPETAGRGGRHS